MKNFAGAVALIFLAVAAMPQTAQADASSWMGDLVDQYAGDPSPMDQSLTQFIFPGTHNSATYGLVDFDPLDPFNAPAIACEKCVDAETKTLIETPGLDVLLGYFMVPFAKAQNVSVLEQLRLGARALDLRFFRANAPDAATSPELTPGEFYAHSLFAGPTATTVFNQISTFLTEGGHEQEIIILRFAQLYEGSGEMSAASLNALFGNLLNTIGPGYFAESSLGQGTTLAQLQAANKQIVIFYNGSTPVASLDPAIGQYIWGAIDGRWYGAADVNTGGSGYPKADTWKNEPELFDWMEALGKRTDPGAMYWMHLSMGPDNGSDFPDMVSRSLACNAFEIFDEVKDIFDFVGLVFDLVGIKPPPKNPDGTTTDPDEFEQLKKILKKYLNDALQGAALKAAVETGLDLIGICPAINDDWDRFRSLEDVAAFTNPKLLPSIVGLPRDQVNILMVDHYPAEFTAEVRKLNQGAARVNIIITQLEERECHDCIPFTALRLSDPDYYPEITFFPKNESGERVADVWPTYASPVDVAEANSNLLFQATTLPPGITEAGETQHNSHWGGPWMETSGTRLKPDWRAFRALSHETPSVDIEIRIWDQDDNWCFGAPPVDLWCGWDDLSRTSGAETSVIETVVSWDTPDTARRDPPTRKIVGGPSTQCSLSDLTSWPPQCTIELDSSVMHYGYFSCVWAPLPGQPYDAATSCDPPSFNTPPVAVAVAAFANTYEGSRIAVSGIASFDPNDSDGSGGYDTEGR
jgi:hypothetical protein